MKSKILFVLCLLTGLMFINAGLDKIFHYTPMPKDMPEKMIRVMAAYATIGWLMPLVAAAEILGGLLIIFPRTRPIGALVLTPLLAGIVLSNISMNPSTLPIVLVIIAVVVWVYIDNKEKFLALVRK